MEKQDKVFIVGVQLGICGYMLHLLSDLRSGKERKWEEEERKCSVCVSVCVVHINV